MTKIALVDNLRRAWRSITSTLSEPKQWLIDFFNGGNKSYSGAIVNEKTALTYTAFWGCVRAIAKPIAALPLHLYERTGDGSRERAVNHPLYRLLHDRPNPEMTALVFRDVLTAHLLTWGNGYAEIQFGPDGYPKALWPLTPNRVTPERNPSTKELQYRVLLPNGGEAILRKEQVFHLVGPGYDGLKGYSIVRLFRESIGMGLSVQEYGARFFGSGAKPGGVLEHPERFKDEETVQRLRKQWEELHSGLSNQHRIAILEEGMKYQQIGIPPEDAQFLETRAFQRTEMAAIFQVPPHKIGDLSNATFSNIEHQGLEFYTDTLLYWLSLWEQTIKWKLIPEFEQDRYFANFLVDGLLRGDQQSRYNAYAIGRQWGWLSANDIRRLENMNPIGPEGDIYLVPLNMVNAADVDSLDDFEEDLEDVDDRTIRHLKHIQTTTKEQRQIRNAQNRARLAKRYEQAFSNAVKRHLRKEVADIRKAVKEHLSERDATTFELWLEEYFGDNEELKKRMKPAFLSLAEIIYEEASKEVGKKSKMPEDVRKFMDEYLETFAIRYNESSKAQLLALVRQAFEEGLEPEDLIDTRLVEWEERRPKKVAMNETVQISGAITKLAFVAAGVTKLRWMAVGSKNCPYCREMDGKVVGINESFVSKDDVLDSEDGMMRIRKPAFHPPLHQGCECVIVAD